MKPSFTLGIEEEYQTIDPATFDLRSHINTELIAQGKLRLKEKVKSEMHQSVIEVGTGVCRTIGEAREDVSDLRRQTIRLAREHGLLLAGTPFATGASSLPRRALPAGRRGHEPWRGRT
jgi:carboxylate-amine ligase